MPSLIQIQEMMELFINKQRIRSDKTVCNYFIKPDGKSLLAVMKKNGTDSWAANTLTADMREVVMQLTRGKETALYWFKKFWIF